jgi:sucrose-6-phosphate hydrolase SacC (GH32 family)
MLKTSGSSSLELKATVSNATGAVGLVVAAAPDMSEYTEIIYEPSNHTLLVVRDHSTTLKKQFNLATVTGYFYPYTTKTENGSEQQESITMDVFVDGSLLEVYVNDRFALATRVYPANECSTGEPDGSK